VHRGSGIAVVASVAIAVLAAGGAVIASDAGGGATQPTLDKPAFIDRADAICAQRYPEVVAYYRNALADEDAGRVAPARSAIRHLETAARRLVHGIEALGPPATGAATVTTLLGDYRQLFADAVENTPASNAAANTLRTEIADTAARFGFRVCGRG
jgi:ABC-type transporter Mla subunit MlaD